MKNIRKFLLLFTVIILVILQFTETPTIVHAAKIKISKKKVSLYIGETYKLKVTGTNESIKWTSSEKSIATVSKDGTITGIKKGGSFITATIGKTQLKCYVIVKTDINKELKNISQEFLEYKNSNGEIESISCLLTNNSNVDFTFGFKMTFYNAAGEKVSVNNLHGLKSSIFKSQSILVTVDNPQKEYTYYTLEYTDVFDSVNYKNMQKYITITPKETLRKDDYGIFNEERKYIDLTVNNSSEDNIIFDAYIKFYKDGKLIDIQPCIYNSLDIGDNEIKNRYYINFDYDNYNIVFSAKALKNIPLVN
jgi:hypothetical protein